MRLYYNDIFMIKGRERERKTKTRENFIRIFYPQPTPFDCILQFTIMLRNPTHSKSFFFLQNFISTLASFSLPIAGGLLGEFCFHKIVHDERCEESVYFFSCEFLVNETFLSHFHSHRRASSLSLTLILKHFSSFNSSLYSHSLYFWKNFEVVLLMFFMNEDFLLTFFAKS